MAVRSKFLDILNENAKFIKEGKFVKGDEDSELPPMGDEEEVPEEPQGGEEEPQQEPEEQPEIQAPESTFTDREQDILNVFEIRNISENHELIDIKMNRKVTILDLSKKIHNYINLKIRTIELDRIVTNGSLGSVLQDNISFTINNNSNIYSSDQPEVKYKIGSLFNNNVFVDPMMRWDDNRIIFIGEDDEISFVLEINDENNIFL